MQLMFRLGLRETMMMLRRTCYIGALPLIVSRDHQKDDLVDDPLIPLLSNLGSAPGRRRKIELLLLWPLCDEVPLKKTRISCPGRRIGDEPFADKAPLLAQGHRL